MISGIKLTSLPELTEPVLSDYLYVVDVSETSGGVLPNGTGRKVQLSNLPFAVNGSVATFASLVLTTEIGVGPAPFSLVNAPFIDPGLLGDDLGIALRDALERLGLVTIT